MPAPLDDVKRNAVLDDIRAGQKSAGQIARDHGVARSTVSRLGALVVGGSPFDRSHTKEATEARIVDHRTRLVKLASRFAGLAESVLDSYEAMGPEEWARVSAHSRGVVAGIAADKAAALAPTDDGVESARSMLGDVAAAVAGAYKQVKAADAARHDEDEGPAGG